MATADSSLAILNRILIRLFRSMPQYLGEAWPWTHRGDEDAFHLVQAIIREEQELAQRLAGFIIDRGGIIHSGVYPQPFTDLNFLALDFVLAELVKYQRQAVHDFEADAAQLVHDPETAALAQQVVATSRGHLAQLEELAGAVASSQ